MDDAAATKWLTSRIPGAGDLIEWFGYWPSFHDAEVTSVELTRSGPSRVAVHVFEITDEVNAKSQYVCRKHVIVSFRMDGILEVELTGFNRQNVLAGLEVAGLEQGYELRLAGCHGVDGRIAAESVCITLEPGPPSDSQYLTEATP